MRFMRIGAAGSERPVVVDDGRAFDLSPVTPDIDGDFFLRGGIAMTASALRTRSLRPVETDDERIGAPIARPQAVVCVGCNYPSLNAEIGLRAGPEPVLFFKHPNAVVGPFDDVVIPPGAQRVDWEVELAVVMGRQAAYLDSDEEALEAIAGVTIVNDISERSAMTAGSGGQWSQGKSAPTFCPLGPALVPLAALPSGLGDLRMRARVNDAPRQDASTAEMVFGVAELVRHVSHFLTLEAGDLVATGSPGGVALSGRFPYLRAGDVVELEIEGLGRQRQRLVAAAVRSPVVGDLDERPAS